MEKRKLISSLLEFEKKYNTNSFEIYDSNNKIYEEWKNILNLLLFSNVNPFLYNKQKEFIGIDLKNSFIDDVYKKNIMHYLKIDKNKNNIIILTNKDKYYKSIIKRASEYSKFVFLISNNKDDLALKKEYEHLIIKITDNVQDELKKINKKVRVYNGNINSNKGN